MQIQSTYLHIYELAITYLEQLLTGEGVSNSPSPGGNASCIIIVGMKKLFKINNFIINLTISKQKIN